MKTFLIQWSKRQISRCPRIKLGLFGNGVVKLNSHWEKSKWVDRLSGLKLSRLRLRIILLFYLRMIDKGLGIAKHLSHRKQSALPHSIDQCISYLSSKTRENTPKASVWKSISTCFTWSISHFVFYNSVSTELIFHKKPLFRWRINRSSRLWA